MKKYLVFFILSVSCIPMFAQRIDSDIFGNLQYESKNRKYKATLKNNIFDDLIYTDNNSNEITFTKKYLDSEYKNLSGNNEAKIDFFRHLIGQYRSESRYKAKYSVDIFDKIIIEDNRNNKIEAGKDIFGNPVYEEKRNGTKISVKKDLSGNWEYRSNKDWALLKKDIFDKWCYSDSGGNKFEFGAQTWHTMERRHGNEENIFFFLIDKFLRQ